MIHNGIIDVQVECQGREMQFKAKEIASCSITTDRRNDARNAKRRELVVSYRIVFILVLLSFSIHTTSLMLQ